MGQIAAKRKAAKNRGDYEKGETKRKRK